MLQVAPAAFHSETPNSSTGHPSLAASVGQPWNSEPRVSYKRRKSKDPLVACKKPKLVPVKDVSKDFGINSSEITLTLIQKPAYSIKDKEEKPIQNYRKCKIDKNNNTVEIDTLPKELVATKTKPVVISFSNSDDINYCEIVSEKLVKRNDMLTKSKESMEDSPSDSYNACMEKINQNAEVSVFRTPAKLQLKLEEESRNDEENLELSSTFEYVNCAQVNINETPNLTEDASGPCDVSNVDTKELVSGDFDYDTADLVNNNMVSLPDKPGAQTSRLALATKKLLKSEKKEQFNCQITPMSYWNNPILPQPQTQIEPTENWDDNFDMDTPPLVIPEQSHLSPDSAYGSIGDSEMSHYLIGFPNPPGENRCWLNATLHALFATLFTLPISNDLQILIDSDKCSKLTKMLIQMHDLWKKGASEKHKVYQMVKNFKEDLSILDETYPSERQQDVSEFLMIFLNYIKTDFEKVLSKDDKIEEIENTPENQQELPRKIKSSPDTGKRQPLASISPKNGKLRRNPSFSDTVPKVQMSDESTKAGRLQEQADGESEESDENKPENPIDVYFQLNMIEDYACKGCAKHRQSSVANLMLYVDLPAECDEGTVDLAEAIDKTFAAEERSLTCENCKHDTHDMKIYFKEYPKVMMVQINRYGISKDGMMTKICTAVKIPESLPLSYTLEHESIETKTYEPICIISHVGSNMDCGHYTSYVKYEDQWFHYNDLTVSPMTSKDALKAAQATAYIIFYADSDILAKIASDCFTS